MTEGDNILRGIANDLDSLMRRRDEALFQLLAQLELATSSEAKWVHPVTREQVTLAYKFYRQRENEIRNYIGQTKGGTHAGK